MLELSRHRAAGSHPLVTPERTAGARHPARHPRLAPETKVVPDPRPDRAGATAGGSLARDLELPNYRTPSSGRASRRTTSRGGSDRLVDALFA